MSKDRDQRRFPRTFLAAKIRIAHASIGQALYETRDISDGGVFIVSGEQPFPPVGSLVTVQLQGLPIPAPEIQMVVVRRGGDGFGLCFVQED